MLPKHALQAAGVENHARAHLHALRGLRLIRAREGDTTQMIEPYHDRVREAIVDSLPRPLRLEIQAALLNALEQDVKIDAGWLFSLALEVSPARALRHGLAAADHAESVLAFERAAELLQHCVVLLERERVSTDDLRLRLADCLGRAGHGVRAAEVYLNAANSAAPNDALALRRVAASHLLRCGEYERGNRIVYEVVRAHGFAVPETDAGVFAAIGWERAKLAIRGLKLKPNQSPSAEEHAKGLLFGTLAIEYQAYDPLRTVLFQSYGLRLALAYGDRHGLHGCSAPVRS